MQKALVLSCVLLLGGCSLFPGLHRIEVQQGNMVTQDMLNKLRPGMTEQQVRFVMGTPLLVDSFNQNRWDYLYRLEKPNGDTESKTVSLYFNNGKLANIQGTMRPGAAAESASSSAQ
ncbi:outer membrane protein assembly factor BamE [Pokkaliibacter sp. CJK22405]|uniref:outer membrane protein assembly factor BamE n=1 Tax=Pokkaliibacter sp. CJK22405 TaxID=3384615 RepID=UPI003984A999